MVDVDTNPMPPKVIGKEACLRTKGLHGLSKDLGPKRPANIWRKEKSKEIMDFVKMEDGGVNYKRYNGSCMKQIRIPKVTWTSPILRKRPTCCISFKRASLMKDDVKVKVPNGTFKTLILLDGVLKFGGKPKGDHVTHFLG